MYINQYIKTWNSVFVNKTTDFGNYLNRFSIWSNLTYFNWETSNSWNYVYSFKVYTPTSNQDSTYWKKSDKDAEFKINSLTFDVNQNTFWNITASSLINNLTTKFNPLYYTEFSGDIKSPWFVEWANQNSVLTVKKNWTTSTSSNNLYLEFWSWTQNYSPNFNLNINWNQVLEWNWNKTLFWELSNLSIASLLTQTWWVASLNNQYLSSHIEYTLDGKTIVYNSDIIWKTSYWESSGIWNTTQVWLKILWKVNTKKETELITNQSNKDIHNIKWEISKSSLKQSIRNNTFSLVKNIPINNWGKIVNTLWGNFWTNTDWKKILWNKVLYFWAESAEYNVELNSWTFSWNKTIVIIWGNLRIKWNISYSDKTKDNLWIIVLKDSNWNWWNLYIDDTVTNIVWSIYLDKSVFNYSAILNRVTLQSDSIANFKNQLYIQGSLFSENTIWGSRANPLQCPYYITVACSQEEAQKYDLNYLRRYFRFDSNLDSILDTVANSWYSAIWISGNYLDYPVIIEYNSTIQTSPPPLFEN